MNRCWSDFAPSARVTGSYSEPPIQRVSVKSLKSSSPTRGRGGAREAGRRHRTRPSVAQPAPDTTLVEAIKPRRATSLQCPPRRLRLANRSSPGSAAMPDLIWRWIGIWRRIGLRVLARGSDYVCTLAGRLNDALLHNEAITDRALR